MVMISAQEPTTSFWWFSSRNDNYTKEKTKKEKASAHWQRQILKKS